MSRTAERPQIDRRLLARLIEAGAEGPGGLLRQEILQAIRGDVSPEVLMVELALLEECDRHRRGLHEARGHMEQLKEMLDKLTAPPLHMAVVRGRVDTPAGPRIVVAQGQGRRVVGAADDVDADSLAVGDEVFLSHEMNVVIGVSPVALSTCGDTASFARYTGDGNLVLRTHAEEVVAEPVAALAEVELRSGDIVRWDRALGLAYERIQLAAARGYFLDELPEANLAQFGGRPDNLRLLIDNLRIALDADGEALRFGLTGRRSILLKGPPGCGKTLMVRIAASLVSREAGQKCHFAVVKPSEWESPYVGQTQQNIRDCFQAFREAARDGFVVVFFDEVESLGRARGAMNNGHSDKFLASFLAELDGLVDRGNVAVVSATNATHLIDPALWQRIAGIEISVPRPDMAAARDIFAIHLPSGLPYSPNGSQAADTRREVVEAAVSRLYSPNADNQLYRIKFRDGSHRGVFARDLISGRIFAQICDDAKFRAYRRHGKGEGTGLQVEDMHEAVSAALVKLGASLSVRNIRAHLDDLPDDLDVVGVEPIVRRIAHPHRYLHSMRSR